MRKQWRWNHRSNWTNESGSDSDGSRWTAHRRSPRRAAVLRDEPGAVQALRLASNRDRALAGALLSRGTGRRDGRREDGREIVRAPVKSPGSPVPGEKADHHLL